ncbi:Asp23/Gls24 family envelope stress response protein [Streptococcus phocae subsp. phocae]|uniref:Stress response regulator gls24 homolog n=1 Tax=Streptococcus phocae TaxID=119224 RepID=A0A0P6S3N8_9STRE|nr:Asp23/Gls24 family envelope stress response protein [Streptococcus phocae]KGR73059.1 stress response regulator Gls24 [Streptococcus phocae subsp. salmonis]KPJ23236.1 stress response regulator Gls24 [Streptococcus phocae]
MTETYIKNTKPELAPVIRGELTYEDKVIEKIVGLALESVDGLLGVSGGFFSNLKDKLVNTDSVRDGVNVEVGKKQVAIDLDIVAEYQKHVPTIYDAIKAVVEEEVKKMTDLDVIEVNVKVVDIKTRQQFEAEKVSLQDKMTEVAKSTSDFTSQQVDNVKSSVGAGVEKIQDQQAEPRVK